MPTLDPSHLSRRQALSSTINTPKSIENALGDLPRLKRSLDASPFDAIVAASPENVRYVGDTGVWTQTVIRERPVFIVWPKGADPVYIVGTIEIARIRRESWIRDIRSCEQTTASAVGVLAQVLRELKLDAGCVAMELDYMPVRWLSMLQRELPKMAVDTAEPLLSEARMHKSAAERAHMAHAFRSTQQAFLDTFREIRPGDTEKQAAIRLTTRLLENGADGAAFIFLTAGANALLPHPQPTDRVFQRDEMVKSDSGGFFSDYFTNLGRTMRLGPLTDQDRSYWARLRDIQDAVADMLRPGNTGRQLYEKACMLYVKAGLAPPNAHNGHGIGLRIHERPMVSAHEDTPYEAGMISTIETRTPMPGHGSYHMEDLYEVTDGAPILHTGVYPSREMLSFDT
jgi:Xaa-Pro aminopeptidase